jgi:hypothetical protein
MAFMSNNGTIISFADYDDVISADQRLFESNEGLTDEVIEDALIRSTERILTLFRSTSWWHGYYVDRATTLVFNTVADIPALDPDNIQDRLNDFTDLCVYYSLYNYILPKIADFSNEENAERAKIGFYQVKFDKLFGELIDAGDWYNFDGSGSITSAEKQPGTYNLKRVR